MLDNFKPVKKVRRSVTRLDEPQDTPDEPQEIDFKPPEEVAATNPEEPIELPDSPSEKPKKSRFPKFSKKQWLLIAGCFLLVLASGSTAWALTHRQPPADNSAQEKTVYTPPPPKTTEISPLTGMEVPIADAALPTTSVQIENSPDARPQAGLYDAGVVVEAIAEGGITRFNAMFQEAKPERIGPVRSARPYYLDFVMPYDASIAHAGGSGQALAEIRAFGMKDIDHGANGSTFYRDSNRYAPHNLYTSRAKLLEVHAKNGWTTSKFNGFPRKKEAKAATPTARAVDVNISGFLYNPRFEYDAATNSYLRSQAGKPHLDENGKQINPKVIVVLVMSHSYSGIYSVYGTTGSGKTYIFQDGTVTEGIWEKTERSAQIRFGDANGAPIGLNPGQVWMSLVGSADRVSITP